MRRILAALTIAVGLTAGVGAITYGIPDGNAHPNVGLLIARIDAGYFAICSGTLVAPDVFLTAGHCTAAIDDLEADTFVTFTSAPPFSVANFLPGTPHTHPDFGTSFPNTADIGVVVLDTPVLTIAPARIPSAGFLDHLSTRARTERRLLHACRLRHAEHPSEAGLPDRAVPGRVLAREPRERVHGRIQPADHGQPGERTQRDLLRGFRRAGVLRGYRHRRRHPFLCRESQLQGRRLFLSRGHRDEPGFPRGIRRHPVVLRQTRSLVAPRYEDRVVPIRAHRAHARGRRSGESSSLSIGKVFAPLSGVEVFSLKEIAAVAGVPVGHVESRVVAGEFPAADQWVSESDAINLIREIVAVPARVERIAVILRGREVAPATIAGRTADVGWFARARGRRPGRRLALASGRLECRAR